MKITGYIIAAIIGFWAVLSIVYMWNHDVVSFANYIKITVTSAIAVVAVGVIAVIFRETKKEIDYKKGDYLD